MNEIEVFDKPELITAYVDTVMAYFTILKSTALEYGCTIKGIEEEVCVAP
jgi:hypothetical protein